MSTENGSKLENILRELSQLLKTAFAARLDKVILSGIKTTSFHEHPAAVFQKSNALNLWTFSRKYFVQVVWKRNARSAVVP
ncbi:MAG: hypothetical protein AB1649_25265 [Chloroflexota bacterium]